MPNLFFNPRINNKNMDPAFYDHNYVTHWPDYGPAVVNPYDITSSNALARQSAYIWGRFYETILYHELRAYHHVSWNNDDLFGRITEEINGSYSQSGYWTAVYWQDPTIFDYTSAVTGDSYTYSYDDNYRRYTWPNAVGQIVTFIDTDNNDMILGGVIENFISYNHYVLSYLDTTQHVYPNAEPVKTIEITDGLYQGILGRAIEAYWETWDSSYNLIIGRPIGAGKIPWFYNKRFNDQRRGLIIDGPD